MDIKPLGKDQIKELQLLFMYKNMRLSQESVFLSSLIPLSSMSLLIFCSVLRLKCFPWHLYLTVQVVWNLNRIFPCVLCQEVHWQMFPEKSRKQMKNQIKLPNCHCTWKFWSVQESVSALTSDQNMLSVMTGQKMFIC